MAASRAVRLVSLACFGSWALLTAMQLQLIPFTRYAWGFNLWAYLPAWVGACLAAAALSLCSGTVRDALATGAGRIGAWMAQRPAWLLAIAGFALAVGLLWLVRERKLFGDSSLLLLVLHSGWQFVFPEIGATVLMRAAMELGSALSFGEVAPAQLLSCISGGLTLMLFFLAGRYLAPGRGKAAAVTALILSGGCIRIFAGHVEVYSLLLAAVAAYLWLVLAFLERRASWLLPALALGLAIWIHAAALCLIPSFAVASLLASPKPRRAEGLRRIVAGLAIAALPTLLYLAGLCVAGFDADLVRGLEKAAEVLGRDPDPDATRWWVRGWGGAPSVGTDVVFLSWAHLKYLVNAAHILAPAALAVLLALLLAAPRSFVATPAALFLGAAALPSVVYAITLRPFWGPFDWDLFSITTVCLAALASHLLAVVLSDTSFRHVAVWLIGFQLLFVGVPFLAIGIESANDAGPFVAGSFRFEIGLPNTLAEELAPWF
jgi:hypothetical protein